jgi:hypothetical protein
MRLIGTDPLLVAVTNSASGVDSGNHRVRPAHGGRLDRLHGPLVRLLTLAWRYGDGP